MRRGVEEVNGTRRALDLREVARTAFVRVVATILVAGVIAGCGGEPRRAERLYREAEQLAADGKPGPAVERLEQLLRDYPQSATAARAREQIVLYRGLAEAERRFPQRRAREIVVAVARAIERYGAAHRAPPEALAVLVPELLDGVPSDPWGRALVYAREGSASYRLASLGADGVRGGGGDDADIVVVNGRFVEDVAP